MLRKTDGGDSTLTLCCCMGMCMHVHCLHVVGSHALWGVVHNKGFYLHVLHCVITIELMCIYLHCRYTDDIPYSEGELYAGLVVSARPHAKITVDYSEAVKMEGVTTYVGAQDVPGSNCTGILTLLLCSHNSVTKLCMI